jgi:hypothetical protein
MDLYRQAAEKFESAGDIRHEEVVTHMRKFLAKPTTVSILDGSYKQPTESLESETDEVHNEVIDKVISRSYGEGLEKEVQTSTSSIADKEFVENIDNLVKEMKSDYGHGGSDNDVDDDQFNPDGSPPTADFTSDDIDVMAADLDAMMKEADKELAELMNS